MCFFSNFSVSDLINVIGIVINFFLAIWIINKIQSNATNRRTLKDHFINETKDIRQHYSSFLSDLSLSKVNAKEIPSWFKLMNIKCQNLLDFLNSKYKIHKDVLNPYTVELRSIVTGLNEFNSNYKGNKKIKLQEDSKSELIKFQQKHNQIFNDLIMKINDAK